MARILFVDDDPLTLETLRRSVEIFGHEAILASSGEEAQTLAADQKPDMIMTDMRLPDIDGLSLVRLFKESPDLSEIPVIVLSASPEMDVAELSLASGAEEFITKPVRLQTLQEVIQRYIGD